MGDLGIGEVNS